ncbi:unnamed protein product [Allacma fusca]|uniref:C2H2-type domain-containing protein n=1 Tax=Allacma fusca TaxID=39272 RepID=A0A8J2KVT4_9HEXA|nr:unnamed protein product [Allacma fusca]
MPGSISRYAEDQESLENSPQNALPSTLCYCGKQFKKEIGLKDHLQNAHQKKLEIACKVCGEVFKMGFQLLKHVEEEHENVSGNVLHQCKECHKKFLNSKDLAGHLLTHQLLNYSCDECGKKFQSKNAIRNHYTQNHPDCNMPTNEELGIVIS